MSLWVRIKSFLIIPDELGNVTLGPESTNPLAGDPHYTLSQRWALDARQGKRYACVLCKLLTLAQNGIGKLVGWPPIASHCEEALQGVDVKNPITEG
jgi:hypothetical protein